MWRCAFLWLAIATAVLNRGLGALPPETPGGGVFRTSMLGWMRWLTPAVSAESPENQQCSDQQWPRKSPCCQILCIGPSCCSAPILNARPLVAEELAAQGLPTYRQNRGGRQRERLDPGVRRVRRSAQLLVSRAALAPTPETHHRGAWPRPSGAPLQERPRSGLTSAPNSAGRGRPVATSNRKQALLPVGAQVLPIPPVRRREMIWSPRPGLQTVAHLPGVPPRLRAMWNGNAVDC